VSYHVASCKQAGWHIRPPWAREQGLALVEVVVASLILGIAVAGARSVGLGPTLLAGVSHLLHTKRPSYLRAFLYEFGNVGSCTSIVRVIPSPENQVKFPHITTV